MKEDLDFEGTRIDLSTTAYDKSESENYDKKRFTTASGKLFDEMEKEMLDEALNNVPLKSRILEVGAGTGRFSIHAARQGYETHLVDLSWPMLRISNSKFVEWNIKFNGYLCTSNRLPFRSRSFDFVLAIRLINQLSSRKVALQTIKEMFRVCKSGGYILFEFVNSKGLSRFANSDCTFLSVEDVHQLLNSINTVSIVNINGILFFSETVLNKIPNIFKKNHLKIDRFFCSLMPHHATRCYVLLKKSGDELR